MAYLKIQGHDKFVSSNLIYAGATVMFSQNNCDGNLTRSTQIPGGGAADRKAVTRGHNKQNEITRVSGATPPTYDADGNLTKD